MEALLEVTTIRDPAQKSGRHPDTEVRAWLYLTQAIGFPSVFSGFSVFFSLSVMSSHFVLCMQLKFTLDQNLNG